MDDDASKAVGFFIVRELPDAALAQSWEDTIVPAASKLALERFSLIARGLDVATALLCAVYRIVLLYGPPGCGKTSLARACANRVAERVKEKTGKGVKLLELNLSALFSEYLGRSVKAIAETFEKVRFIARHEPPIVLFDEVESVGVERTSLGAGDPSDVMRSVVALLNEIDRLRECEGVLVYATSNMTGAIDRAVWDRADLKLYVGRPGKAAARRILEQSAQKLASLNVQVRPSFLDALVRALYNGSAEGFLSGRDLARLFFLARCFGTRNSITVDEVVRIAKSVATQERRKGNG